MLETFQERKEKSICCVENGLEKSKKWGSMQEAVAEAQVRDAGGLDQGVVARRGEVSRSERGLGEIIELTVRDDWFRGWGRAEPSHLFCDLSKWVGCMPVTVREPWRRGMLVTGKSSVMDIPGLDEPAE